MVYGLEFRVSGGLKGLGFRAEGLGLRTWG